MRKLYLVRPKLSTVLAVMVGTGLALFPIRIQQQTMMRYFFIASVSYALIFGAIFLFITKTDFRKLDRGSPWVFIPMMVMVIAALARWLVYGGNGDMQATFFMTAGLVLYFISRKAGAKTFYALIPFAIIEVVSVIILAIKSNGITGGLYFVQGYNEAVGYITYAALLIRGKYQWLWVVFCLLGLFFTGSAEAVFVVGVLGLFLIIRRDWSKKLWIPVGVVSLVVIIATLSGFTEELYWRAIRSIEAVPTAPVDSQSMSVALSGRWEILVKAVKQVTLLGHGFQINLFTYYTPHNVPLVIIDQLGIFAGLAWTVVTVYCLIKTKWKYAWVGILALSAFDHYVFTQLAPFWACVVGVTTASTIKNDYIFKERHDRQPKPELLGGTVKGLQPVRMGE